MASEDIVILQIDDDNDVDLIRDIDDVDVILVGNNVKHFNSFTDADVWLGNNAEGGYTYRMINLNEQTKEKTNDYRKEN